MLIIRGLEWSQSALESGFWSGVRVEVQSLRVVVINVIKRFAFRDSCVL